MISRLLYALQSGASYVKNHPHILFALLIVVVLPLAFLYSGDQFLKAGTSFQDRLQKDRIGILQDSFAAIIRISVSNPELIEQELQTIAAQNPDITKFRIARFTGGEVIPVIALNKDIVGVPEEEKVLYQNAMVRPGESIIFQFAVGDERLWQVFRAVEAPDGNTYFIFNELSLASRDALLASKKQSAFVALGVIYIFVLGIAYWLVRITDYRFLYHEAANAVKTKDLFTNMIAHELRAPLTAMRGYASMIDESKSAHDEERKYALRIKESSERLLAIVNDLLDVARIQSGKLATVIEAHDVSPIVVAVAEELGATAQEKKISLTHSGTDTPHTVSIDKKRMHQALTNLVSNALKYTKHGSIEVVVEEKAQHVEIRVKDTGMGISAEDQKQLFAPFFRVENDDVSAITGTGLGMWITRQLIELMDAKIGVESIKGVGTHIVITLKKAS